MLTLEEISSFEKESLPEISKTLGEEDICQLVDWLSEKDDTIRYNSFLLLQNRSREFSDVYPYWDSLCRKLKSNNSYQRSIGLMLTAANVKWDNEDKIDSVIDEYLSLLKDEKPITVRQCIQSLSEIVPYRSHLNLQIADSLMSLDIAGIKETMQ